MKKIISQIVISLCILLLAAYSQICAHATADVDTCLSKQYQPLTQTTLYALQRDAPFIMPSRPPDWNATAFILEVSEVKEEEDSSHDKVRLKKKPRASYFTFIFNGEAAPYFSSNRIRKFQSLNDHPDLSSNKRFVALRVFRI